MIDRRLTPPARSLDLRFLELDMLAHDGIVFAERQLLGLGAWILLRDVEEAGVCRADELNLDGARLGHDPNSCWFKCKSGGRAAACQGRAIGPAEGDCQAQGALTPPLPYR